VSPTETAESTTREIEVKVPAEEVTRETDALIQKYQKLARIPGFRRGHVPASVIRQRFRQDIQNDVVDALVPKYFRKETERLGLTPISQPRVTDLHVHDGEGLHFKASFDVMPAIKVDGYKELRAEHPETVVTDQEVDDQLKALQESKATYSPVEGRSVEDGDFAQVSLDGTPKMEDEGTKPVHMDDILVEIAGKNTMQEFTENLRGTNPGDERTFDVNYPDDFSDERLRGKAFAYKVKVNAIKQKSLPELTMISRRKSESSRPSTKLGNVSVMVWSTTGSTKPSGKPRISFSPSLFAATISTSLRPSSSTRSISAWSEVCGLSQLRA